MNGRLLQDMAWSKSIEVYHPDIAKILRMSAKPMLLASGLGFAEGLLWHKGGFLIFSDLVHNKIYKYTKQGGVETLLHESGGDPKTFSHHSHHIGSNGIAYDREGNFVVCQHGNHALARLYHDCSMEVLVDSFNGKRLNSPNDLVTGPDGSIYFTDPPYGLASQILHPELAQEHAGIYRWYDGRLELLSTDFHYPNGICFSPDCRYLYVSSNHEEEKMIRRYELQDGKLINGTVFIAENADGIKTDARGNLFLSTHAGVRIFSGEGVKLGMIKTPDMVTNLCIEGKSLYIGTPHKLYRFALKNERSEI